MHEKLKKFEEKILEGACAKLEELGFCGVDAEELGEVTDMLKDLSEARYYDAIVDAMGVPDEPERMGYDAWRYASGRFAPTGRGERRGYMPPYMGQMDWEGPQGYQGAPNGARSADNGQSGYQGERSYNAASNGNSGRYGYTPSYDEWQERRRSYTEAPNSTNRRAMEDSAERHFDEVIETTREIWGEVDQPMKLKLQHKLAEFVNGLEV